MKGSLFGISVILCFLCLVLFSCSSPEQSRKILSFFFDGVPEYDTIDADVMMSQEGTESGVDTAVIATTSRRPEYVLHPPYKERMCTTCHLENSLGQLADRQPGLCYMCHEDFSEKYQYIHGPVAAGYCTECHHPHMSKNEKLLIRTGQDLCLFCHDAQHILKGETHEGIEDTSCTECHNPHGSTDRYLFN